MGNAGDVKPVGHGISELRVDYGPGYRVYFVERGSLLTVLLCAGDKRTQTADIRRAIEIAEDWPPDPPTPASGDRSKGAPYRDGTTHVIFEPEDFIARLAVLVPKPRAHLTRYGVFAPASPDRARIVPRTRAAVVNDRGEASVTDRRRSLTWAQRLKRVFAIEVETCRGCGGRLRVIASIEAPAVIERILEHLGRDVRRSGAPEPRAAPGRSVDLIPSPPSPPSGSQCRDGGVLA